MFIDYTKITVESGKGGNGCVSFRREKYIPRGGPDGGDGGKGGNVIITVEKALHNLTHLYYTPHFKAESGEYGKGSKKHGKAGKDIIVKVPPGTVIYKKMQSGEKELIADLIEQGAEIIVAKGGKGGIGNVHFKSSTNRAPRKAIPGEEGEKLNLIVELKLIADVGFVGYPNAGKSTLLSCISNAKPKIASYPFTTLTPSLGTVVIPAEGGAEGGNDHKIIFADIPGIIDGASKGKGLGLEFLRHIERTRLLAFILDITQEPLKQYETLKKELFEYNPLVLKKPSVVVLNKIDLCKDYKLQISQISCQRQIRLLSGGKSAPTIIPISALNGEGIDKFLIAVNNKISRQIGTSYATGR